MTHQHRGSRPFNILCGKGFRSIALSRILKRGGTLREHEKLNVIMDYDRHSTVHLKPAGYKQIRTAQPGT